MRRAIFSSRVEANYPVAFPWGYYWKVICLFLFQSAGGITVLPRRVCLTHRYVLAGTTPRPRKHLSIPGWNQKDASACHAPGLGVVRAARFLLAGRRKLPNGVWRPPVFHTAEITRKVGPRLMKVMTHILYSPTVAAVYGIYTIHITEDSMVCDFSSERNSSCLCRNSFVS